MVSDSETGDQPRQCLLNRMVGGGVSLAAFGLYLATLAPTVLEADGGEFQFVPWLPGIAHPTGYPLYILLGWLWTHLLPVGEVAWRMNLLSAVLAAVAVGFTYAAARRLLDATLPETAGGARAVAAAIAAATFAVSHTFWSQAVIAEVYALHALFVAAILWLVIDPSPSLPLKRGGWLAFTVGLSLTHHRTIVLLLPAVALFLWRKNKSGVDTPGDIALMYQAKAWTPASILGGLRSAVSGQWIIYTVLLTAPLLLYLYLPLIAPFTPYTTLRLSETQTLILYDNSPSGFWRHVTGSIFTGELKPAAAGWDRLLLAWRLLRQQVGWVGVGLALSGIISLWLRGHSHLLGLTGLAFVAFVAFNLIYFIGDVFVLFIPAWLVVALWIGLGCLGLAHWLASSFVRRRTAPAATNLAFGPMAERLGRRIYQLITLVLVVGGLFLPLTLLATRYDEINQSHNFAARDRWQAILAEPLPEGAILLSNDRNEIMPMWYYQYVEGRRPDLLGLFPLIVSDPAYANIGRVLDPALASGRPVYLIKPMAGLEVKAELTPAGTLFRATAYSTPPMHPLDLALPPAMLTPASGQVISETINLQGYDLSPVQARPGTPLQVTLYWQATQPLTVDYTSFVHLVGSDGQAITQSDHRPGGDFYPSRLWQEGEILRDAHTLNIPAPLPGGVYRLRAGMYYQPQPGVIAGMGGGVDIGSVTIQP